MATENDTLEQEQEEEAVRYFPLDVTKLVKGQTLGIEELEQIMGIKRDDPRWWLRLLSLRQKIERLRTRQGLPVLTMRTHKATLVVCDDSDASGYNRGMGKRGIRRFARASYRNIHVDATKLSEELAAAHGRTIMRQAMMLAAIRGARHRALAPPQGNGRTTPRMVAGPVASGS